MVPPMAQRLTMAKAGTPQVSASFSNHAGVCQPVGSRGSMTVLSRPCSWLKTHFHMTAMPTPARTLGRYQTARWTPMDLNSLFMSMAAKRAASWLVGTASRVYQRVIFSALWKDVSSCQSVRKLSKPRAWACSRVDMPLHLEKASKRERTIGNAVNAMKPITHGLTMRLPASSSPRARPRGRRIHQIAAATRTMTMTGMAIQR